MSKAERTNARPNAKSPPDHLGPFRRELLLHLATVHASHPRVPAEGLRFTAKEALADGVGLTPSLASRISNALRALDELGYIRRTHPQHGVVMVRLTPRGLKEAVEAAERWGLSKREYKDTAKAFEATAPSLDYEALANAANALLEDPERASLNETITVLNLLDQSGPHAFRLAQQVAELLEALNEKARATRYADGEQRRILKQFAFLVAFSRSQARQGRPPGFSFVDDPFLAALDKLATFRFTSDRLIPH